MYLIVTQKKWHHSNFNKIKKKNIKLISNNKKFNFKNIKKINPELIFFPHWSYKVSEKILNNYKCVCFHETDLPYGRGGTPIQNLIIRRKKKTKITAFIMNDKIDSGDVITKRNLSLRGSAQEIYERSSKIIFKIILKIIKMKKITSYKQKGKIVKFKRLKNNSNISSKIKNIDEVYNHIRMLDADSYKKAYLDIEKIRITFFNVKRIKNKLLSTAIIEKK